MQIALWIVTFLCLAVWTLVAWGAQAVLSLDPSSLQDLKPLIDQIPFGAVLDQWVPGWRGLLELTVDLTQTLLGWVGHAAPWLVWAVWGVGTVLTLVLAGIASLAIVLIRKGMRTETRLQAPASANTRSS